VVEEFGTYLIVIAKDTRSSDIAFSVGHSILGGFEASGSSLTCQLLAYLFDQ
jgi:hypothetical protein